MFWSRNKNQLLMPGEWEKHSATWLAWPNDDDFFGNRIEAIKNKYLEIIKALHQNETVKLLVLNEEKEKEVKEEMIEVGIDVSKIIFFKTEYVDVWMRDYGPTFLKNGTGKIWIKWNYDGYGGKFPELFPDDDVFYNLKDKVEGKITKASFAMEGGAIDSNGKGVILTTEECLISNRNKGKDKNFYEDSFEKIMGTKKIIWLNKGLVNDHTDGHIDEVARFVDPSKILCSFEEDENNENHKRLKENYEILEQATDQDGNKFEIIKLPMPHMKYEEGDKEHHGKDAPVSYANFYIANETVLVSTFNDPNDEKAISIIKSCFPDREVVGIDSRELIYGGGAIHCITQQELI